ncbi:MAG: type I-E CRISPR-associated protein Cse1/CasA [Selenomonas ruminantium]|jgi:CRISPR type I-E-associated protein CasA/Cse1|nr:type I-E CRISPR-associated protein Cse1/CasA [Selenomonas ruminantium]
MIFDVRTEPWIPVQDMTTGDVREVGLRELLEHAQDYRQISGENAMETYSMYRFLSVFLLRVYQPKDWETKYEMLAEGRFAMKRVKDYFCQCELAGVSFDLFDAERPFLQAIPNDAYDAEKNVKSIAGLDGTRASGNNSIHHDHTLEAEATMTPAQAMRGLLTAQIFVTAMSGGYPSNVYGAPPMFFLPEGRNLFETLVLSMPAAKKEDSGKPVWENPREIIPKADVATADQLYGMLFPARRIRLCPPEEGMVRRMYYQPGLHFIGFAGWEDPHVARRPNKDGDFVSIKPSLDREPWRNLISLNQFYAKGAPSVLRDFAEILREDNRHDMPVMMFGLATSNASLLGLQQGKIHLDNRIVADAEKVEALVKALGLVEAFGRQLSSKNNGIVAIIAPENSSRGQHEADAYRHRYFAYCEGKVPGYMDELAQAASLDDYRVLKRKWQQLLLTGVSDIVQEAEHRYCFRAADLVRAQQQERFLFGKLYKILREAGYCADDEE